MEFLEGNPGNTSLEAHCLNGQILACLIWAGTVLGTADSLVIRLKPERFFFSRGEGARGL